MQGGSIVSEVDGGMSDEMRKMSVKGEKQGRITVVMNDPDFINRMKRRMEKKLKQVLEEIVAETQADIMRNVGLEEGADEIRSEGEPLTPEGKLLRALEWAELLISDPCHAPCEKCSSYYNDALDRVRDVLPTVRKRYLETLVEKTDAIANR